MREEGKMGDIEERVHTNDGQVKLDFRCAGCDQRIRIEMPCPVCKDVMNEQRARKILGKAIKEEGRLDDVGEAYVSWKPGDKYAVIDGRMLEAGELEAIAWWMRNQGK